MSNQHNLRTKFIPFRPDTIVRTDTHTNTKPNSHVSSLVTGHIFQNVCISGGLMTQSVPVQVLVPIQGGASVFVQPHSHQHQTTHNKWVSSGTIIIEELYNRKDGKICQAIFLGQNKSSGMFELFYGKKDSIDLSEVETASRETREESGNMFLLSKHVYNEKYKVSSSNLDHHAYVVRVNAPHGGIQSSVFGKNQMILSSNGAPYEWRELSMITRIDISDAIRAGILYHTKGNFSMVDVYGHKINIFSRDAEFISSALKSKMNMKGNIYQLTFVKSWNDLYANGNKMYLNGTSVYKT